MELCCNIAVFKNRYIIVCNYKSNIFRQVGIGKVQNQPLTGHRRELLSFIIMRHDIGLDLI